MKKMLMSSNFKNTKKNIKNKKKYIKIGLIKK